MWIKVLECNAEVASETSKIAHNMLALSKEIFDGCWPAKTKYKNKNTTKSTQKLLNLCQKLWNIWEDYHHENFDEVIR